MTGSARLGLVLAVTVAWTWMPSADAVRAQDGKVRAVLFYSPTCPHCRQVMLNDLPAIFARFGGQARVHQGGTGHVMVNRQIELLLVDASWPQGNALYHAATRAFNIPEDRSGVPRLVCGDTVLVGALEIPEQFPGLVAEGLAAGGVPWPAIEGLAGVFPAGYDAGLTPRPPRERPLAGPRASEGSGATSVPIPEPGGERGPATAVAAPLAVPAGVLHPGPGLGTLNWTMHTDPIGGTLALLVLAALVFVVAGVLVRRPTSASRVEGGAVPVLVLLGIAIASYLAYVEASGALAVCGPVGDCNTVQQSPYARLFGVVPVAFLGIVGYLGMFGAWAVARRGPTEIRAAAAATAFVLAMAGAVASAALTALEPFVIGAVCAWCLASSAIMGALLWLLAGRGMAGMRAVGARPL